LEEEQQSYVHWRKKKPRVKRGLVALAMNKKDLHGKYDTSKHHWQLHGRDINA
jgi:hypothetical protein